MEALHNIGINCVLAALQEHKVRVSFVILLFV